MKRGHENWFSVLFTVIAAVALIALVLYLRIKP